MAEEAKRTGGGMQRLVLWLVILALLGAVWYLASERNQRHYRAAVENGSLVVERGRFFPTGTGPVADKIYAPIAVPTGEKPPAETEFDDQNALDRWLFAVLNDWAKSAAKKGDTHLAATLAERASDLPGLTGAQVAELNALKADLAWDEAQNDLAGAARLVDDARRKLEVVRQNGGTHAADAGALQGKLQSMGGDLQSLTKH